MYSLKILQWNARSLASKLCEIENLLHQEDFDIAAISETWFKPHYTYTIRNYQIIHIDRSDGKAGVALVIKKSLKFDQLNNLLYVDGLMMIGISVKLEKGEKLNIVSMGVQEIEGNISPGDSAPQMG